MYMTFVHISGSHRGGIAPFQRGNGIGETRGLSSLGM